MTRSHKIGWLVLAVTLLFVLWRLPRLHGQGFGSFSHDQPFLAKDRTQGSAPFDATLTYHWVASDLADGNVTTFTDRIRGSNLVSSPTPPVKGSNYIAMGANRYLTNWIDKVLSPYTVYTIFKCTNNGVNQGVVFTYARIGTSHEGLAIGGGYVIWRPQDGTVITATTLNTPIDVVASVAANGSIEIYTNGVSAFSGGAGTVNAYWGNDSDHDIVTAIGGAGSFECKGHFYEAGLLESAATVTMVSNIHYRATSLYSVSP